MPAATWVIRLEAISRDYVEYAIRVDDNWTDERATAALRRIKRNKEALETALHRAAGK